jgi:hypothetical protein
MPFSYTQQVILAITPKISAFASLCGSSAILMECLYYDRRKLQRVYHRLLCVMSLYDVIESTFNFMSSWPIPRGSPNVAFAVGTQQSCTLQGFVLQFGLAIPILNLCLGCYYLLVIRYSWTESQISTRAEPYFHASALLITLGTCFASLYLDLFNNSNLWCWIAPLPMDCEDSYTYGVEAGNCVRGDNAWIYRWAFYYAPLWCCILGLMGLMFAVYFTVHNLELQSQKFNVRNKTYSTVVLATSLDTSGHGPNPGMSSGASVTSHTPRQGLIKPPQSKSRRVAIQALWYVGAFYLTFTFATMTRLTQQLAGKTYFPMLLLHTIFDPAQGFFNYIVYIRPRYLSFRDRHPDTGFWETMKLLMTRQDEKGGRRGNITRRSEMASMANHNGRTNIATRMVEGGRKNFKKCLKKTRESIHSMNGGNNASDIDSEHGDGNNNIIGQMMDSAVDNDSNNGDGDDRESQYLVDEDHADEEACKQEIAFMRNLIYQHKQESKRVLQSQ